MRGHRHRAMIYDSLHRRGKRDRWVTHSGFQRIYPQYRHDQNQATLKQRKALIFNTIGARVSKAWLIIRVAISRHHFQVRISR